MERQDELIASVTAKAQPGAMVGPFRIGEQIKATRGTLQAGIAVFTAPQLFPAPAKLAARMAELAHIEPGQQVLEPSAGTGMLCDAIKTAQPAATVFAVEINPRLCELLSQKLASPAETPKPRQACAETYCRRTFWSATDLDRSTVS